MKVKKFDKLEEKMVFKNRPNTVHKLENGEVVWDSRSVAVTCVIMAWCEDDYSPYVLISKRGTKAADSIGKWNCVCGYLDKDESGTDAAIRETWEEVGLNLVELMNTKDNVTEHLEQPWFVNHKPDENRQNVTLRFGISFGEDDFNSLPKLTTKYNEIEGEVETPMWVSFNDIKNYDFAFGHDRIINDYFKLIEKYY